MTERQFETTGPVNVEESIDLEQCHTDPIHRSALVMPHGIFLGVDPDAVTIQSASENTADVLDTCPDELWGQALAKYINETVVDYIEESPPGHTRKPRRFVVERDARRRIASVYSAGEQVGVELQDAYPAENTDEQTMINLRQELGELRTLSKRHTFYKYVVSFTRELLDYDRVMLYRFNDEGHGTVIAEDKLDSLHSYHGQRFPASDIPEPARRLYRKNDLRYIPTIDYEPVPILGTDGPLTGDDLDLTHSYTRNVPLVHREYLENMEVRGSVSVPIVIDNQLWGLIAAHSTEAKAVDWPRRDLARFAGQTVSQQIARFNAEDRSDHTETLTDFQQSFYRDTSETTPMGDRLHTIRDRILSFLDASAFYMTIGEQPYWYSNEDIDPPETLLREITTRLEKQNTVETQSITNEFDEEWSHTERLCGFFALRVGMKPDAFCVWFRPEIEQTITWGGDPRSPVETDEEGRISPRNSFEEWKQIVTGQCDRWTDRDRLTARELSRFFTTVAVEEQSRKLTEYAEELEARNESLRQAKERLTIANREKEDLMDELQHRVKNNFQLVMSLLSMKLREAESEDQRRILRSIRNRLSSMASLHQKLYDTENVNEVGLSSYFDDLISEIHQSFESDQKAVEVRKDVTDVTMDTDRAIVLGIILTELLANAYEHAFPDATDPPQRWIRVEFSRVDPDQLKLEVEDNGVGLQHGAEEIFNRSMGLKLLKNLAEDQLKGSINVAEENGTQFTVTFPFEAPR